MQRIAFYQLPLWVRLAAALEDYRHGIGELEDGVLRITLEARAAGWSPWGESGATLRTHVFAANGAAPRTPGPLIRVTAGTPVHLTVKNSLPHAAGCAT